MAFKYKAAPTYRSSQSTKKIMFNLLLGLLVVYLFGLYRAATYGKAYVINALLMLLVSLLAMFLAEGIFAYVHKENIINYLKASFPWISALILVLTVPFDTSLYAVFGASMIAIIFGKLVFGGFGQNIFNPAGVGRAIIFTSFTGNRMVDVISSATPATTLARFNWLTSGAAFAKDFGGLSNLLLGNYHGAMGETSSLLILLVGVYLIVTGVIDLFVPLTYIGVSFFGALLIALFKGLGFEYALVYIFSGGLIFGAVFMLTDPVTNPTTRMGRIIFSALAALITCIIRIFGNLPEGVVYSILLVNLLTPMIDKLLESKQVTNLKRKTVITLLIVLLCTVSMGLLSLGKEKVSYQSINNTIKVGDLYE